MLFNLELVGLIHFNVRAARYNVFEENDFPFGGEAHVSCFAVLRLS